MKTIARSSFLRATAIAGGGLLLDVSLPFTARRAEAAMNSTPIGAWIKISPDNTISIYAPQSEMGQGVMTSLPMLVAEELDADWAHVVVDAPQVDKAYNNPPFQTMATGGSSAIRGFFLPLRQAGASARAMLVGAAATQWNVPASELRTSKSMVYHDASKRSATYGSLASAAATIPPPEKSALKPREAWTLIGKPVPRVDTSAKVQGKAGFGIDVKVPGMVYAAIRHAPVFGATISSIDDAPIKGFKGPHQVLNLETAAVVVSDRYYRAKKAVEALKISYTGGDTSLSSAKIEGKLRAGMSEKPVIATTVGDADGALKSASKVISAEYHAPYLAHATMEPMNCTASVTKTSCEVWAPSQAPGPLAGLAAKMTGLPPSAIKIHTTYLGGGFGRRFNLDFAAEAIQISTMIGKPVKVVWSREEDIQHDWFRPTSLTQLKGGLDASGNLVAWQQRIVTPSIIVSNPQLGFPPPPPDKPDSFSVEGCADKKYAIPNFTVDTVMKNFAVPVFFWRSVGNSQNGFFFESFMDEMASAAGKDPLEFRRPLLAKEARHLNVLEMAAKLGDWGKPLAKGRGRGIALHESFGSIVGEVAEVSVDAKKKLRVHRIACVVDCGTYVNPNTVEAQMQSAMIYGLTAALYGEITIDKGRVAQNNFYDYPMVHLAEAPHMDVQIVQNTENPGGVGEPGTPPVAPAVANAIFAATGTRVRSLPFVRHGFTA
jgi:isoquinoline 1-oxidoreductase beta subunit